MTKILLVEDERDLATVLRITLERAGYDCLCAYDLTQARAALAIHSPEVVIVDHKLSETESGEELVREGSVGDASCILITGGGTTPEFRAEMMDIGFLYVLDKPLSVIEFLAAVQRAAHHWKTKEDLKQCHVQLDVYNPDADQMGKLQAAVLSFRQSVEKMMAL